MKKEDKIIKDLKERNNKLSNQIKLTESRLYSQEYKNNELQKENKQLKERNNKALDKLDKLNEKLKEIFNVGINNAEVAEIKRTLKGEDYE